jgi:hypothetical protein
MIIIFPPSRIVHTLTKANSYLKILAKVLVHQRLGEKVQGSLNLIGFELRRDVI